MDQHQTNYADNNTALTTTTDDIVTLTTPVAITDEVILFHANRIKASWQKAVSSIIETGQFLLDAKKLMSGTGKWSKLFDKKLGGLPFSTDTAQKLMKVARHQYLNKTEHARFLPPSWFTLSILSDASEKQVKQWITDGKITPNTQRKDAEKLVNPTKKLKKAKSKIAPLDMSDLDKRKSDRDNDVSNTAPSNEVQLAVQHLYTLTTDASADWTSVDWEMVDDLIEELQSRKAADVEQRRQDAEKHHHDKEWQDAELAKLVTPVIPPITE
jgi:hypothetical protein